AMGVTGHLPIIVAFAILALYTYNSGLRAPALIAFVKDTLIYIVIVVAVIVIPVKLGGWDVIFGEAEKALSATNPKTGLPKGSLLLNANNQLQYVTLAFGSALALFLYPHSITSVLAAKDRNTIKRNMAALPAYSFLLGLIALLGYMALAAGVKPIGTDGNTIVPVLFDTQFPAWFAGVAFAAIGIGALVPAAIMSIAAANLFTRNIYKEYLRRDATPQQEAKVSKITSLVVKVGAVACILFLDPQFSIDLQLIGGVIILQTLPSVALGLYTRWFHRGALVAGLIAGLAGGLWMLYTIPNPNTGRAHFGGSAFKLSELGITDTAVTVYVGFLAVLLNLLVAALLTLALRAGGIPDGEDATRRSDYFADAGDPRVHDLPEITGEEPVRAPG
ncbi:MAG TPA: sodium:solute symporter, partial [Mycobacteriales bacterium]|nr:sodium:solute symporter [Mycobacteriales bacterium]